MSCRRFLEAFLICGLLTGSASQYSQRSYGSYIQALSVTCLVTLTKSPGPSSKPRNLTSSKALSPKHDPETLAEPYNLTATLTVPLVSALVILSDQVTHQFREEAAKREEALEREALQCTWLPS